MSWVKSLFFCSVIIAAAGCADWGSSDPPMLFSRFGGRVVNADTGQPIAGVVVKICNYEYQATTDSDGHWFMEIIPGLEETEVAFTFERTGYASTMFYWSFDVEDELDVQNRDFHDTGTVEMRAGVSVMVQVTLDGAPLAGASVACTFGYFNFDGTYEYAEGVEDECTDLAILATTDASGIAMLNNLDPKEDYIAYVPMQDLDGDNISDTTDGFVGINVTYFGMVYAIGLETMTPYGATAIRGSNLAYFYEDFSDVPTGTISGDSLNFPYDMEDLAYRSYYYSYSTEVVSFYRAVVTPNHSVQIVFRNPVDIFEAYFAYYNNLVALTDPLFEEEVRIPGSATVLSGSKFTIYNFIPSTLLPTNERVTLRFIARSRVNPAFSENLSISFYVPLGLPTITVAADNYNGSRDGTNGDEHVWLRFPEAVEGFYKIISLVEDGTTYTIQNPQQVFFPHYNSNFPYYYFSNVEIANNESAAPATGANTGDSGAVAGKQVKVRLGFDYYDYDQLEMEDDVPGTSANSVTVEISCRNINGVTLDAIITLPIE